MMRAQSYWAYVPDRKDTQVGLSFPIREQISPEESGQGYALRMSQLNAIPGLTELKKLMGKSTTSLLSETDAQYLSMTFGASVDYLKFALGSAAYGDSPGQHIYAGHQLSKPSFINRTFPRICPVCIRDGGRSKLSWDFAAVTSCPEHRVVLLDVCGGCGKRISWARSGAEVCSCSAVLDGPKIQAVDVEVQFAKWLKLNIQSAHPEKSVSSSAISAIQGSTQHEGLMGMVWPLSLNAGLLITSALGLAAKKFRLHEQPLQATTPLLSKARSELILADILARQIDTNDPGWFELSSRNPVVNMIAECMSGWATPADKSLAQSLLVKLGGMYKARQWSSPNPQLSQMMLF
jgi:TniQ